MHLCRTTKKPVSWLLLWPNGWFLCDITQNFCNIRKLCDVNFLTRKTLYCNLVSLKTFFAKVDEISQLFQINLTF